MRPILLMLTALTLFATACSLSQAAQFRRVEMPDKSGPAILLTGEIELGDDAAFHKLAETLPNAAVVTTGPGGSVKAALAIGTEIRTRGWSTLVPEGIQCASACSLIWLAGQTRSLAAGAQIGFHAMAVIRDGQHTETHDFDFALRAWLTGLGYAMDATSTIVNTQATSMRWYNVTELRASGIATETFP